MVRGTTAPEAFTVGRILNEAQRSVAVHKKCAAALWRLANRQPAEVLEQLCACLCHVLPVGQVSTPSSGIKLGQTQDFALRDNSQVTTCFRTCNSVTHM